MADKKSSSAQLTGLVLRAGDPSFEQATKGFNAAHHDNDPPRIVVFCQDSLDVSNAVVWARENSMPFRVRCGRHDYEGFSSTVKDGLIIDVSELTWMKVFRGEDGAPESAEIGTGFGMLDLSEKLWRVGASLPLATGASVGLGGCALGGGFGPTSRLYGLVCDHILAMDVVLATGEVVRVEPEGEYQDLFWALCGAGGGNFGVVTSFHMKLNTVRNCVAFIIGWPWHLFEPLVDRWQRWGPDCDPRIGMHLSLKTDGTITMVGQFTAQDEDLSEVHRLLAPLTEALPPAAVSMNTVPCVEAARLFYGVDQRKPIWAVHTHSEKQLYKAASSFVTEPLPAEGIRRLKEQIDNAPALHVEPSQPIMVQLLCAGGEIRTPNEKNCIAHRDALYCLQFDGFWTDPRDEQGVRQWVASSRLRLDAWTKGAYVGYLDSDIEKPPLKYYGDNLPKLIEIKKKYDPDNLFFFNERHNVPIE
jgi:FAD/FMN-containing dehydrogenase